MLARVGRVGQENPCRAGLAYLCSRQVLRLGQGYQLARVGWEWESFSLWVAVLPHKGHRETVASPCQPEGNGGELVGPWACCRISRRLTRNRGHPSANVTE